MPGRWPLVLRGRRELNRDGAESWRPTHVDDEAVVVNGAPAYLRLKPICCRAKRPEG